MGILEAIFWIALGIVVGVIYYKFLNEPVKRLLAWFKSLAVHPKE